MSSTPPQLPFVNPRIPFTGSIHGGLQEGKIISIIGRVLPGADRFHVNLQCGSRSNPDIVLQINPRYDRRPGYVVTNTFQNGCWGSEERLENSPFITGDVFSLYIMAYSHAYKLMVNGFHFMEYRHRVPLSLVDTVSVSGTVVIASIDFQSWTETPYRNPIPRGLEPGRTITIRGKIHDNARNLVVNLVHGQGIALHYNPRFQENLVVLNSKTGDKWGSEERDKRIPVQRGETFTLVIYCESHSFRIMVNGTEAHTYKYRFTPLRNVTDLEVDGDVSLSSVSM